MQETQAPLPNTPVQPQPTPPQTQVPAQTPETAKSFSKTMWYLLGVVVALVLLVGMYFILQKPKTITQYAQPVLQPTPTLPRSKALGVITNVVTASSLDAQGNAASPSATFATTDKNIYLVLTFSPKVGTRFEYIRYLNDKLLDNGALKILKPNMTNSSFVWSLSKPGAVHLAGNYRVKIYTNGIFEKEISYVVR